MGRRASPWAKPRRKFSVKLKGAPACPGCHAVLDGATSADLSGGAPKANDLTVCCYCAAILEFTAADLLSDKLALIAVTGDELILALANPTLRRVRQDILMRHARADHERELP